MNQRRLALLFSLICICPVPPATAQNRSQQTAYRPQPAPRQPSSYSAPANNNYRQPSGPASSYRSPAFSTPPPSRNGSASSFNGSSRPGLGFGNMNSGAGQTGGSRNVYQSNSPANDRVAGTYSPRSLFNSQNQVQGLPRNLFRGSGTVPAPSAGMGQNFGIQVKPLVGSGTASRNDTSGLRNLFKVEATGGGRGGSGGGGNGGGPPSYTPRRLSSLFNAAAGNGEGRIDGTKTQQLLMRPKASDAFGHAAMQAEKEIAMEERGKKGKQIHEMTLVPKPTLEPNP